MIAAEASLAYRRSGLCVLPALGAQKRPALPGWKQYQTRLPTEEELRHWFAETQALCLICGKVSGNLEMLDFDLGGEAFQPWYLAVEQANAGLLSRLVIEQSPSGGWHVVYRSEVPVSGNLKLAQRKQLVDGPDEVTIAGKAFKPRQDVDSRWHVLLTLIETRGEGGLFLCAPSPGYELLQGDFAKLPVLSDAEREFLLETAWSLNQYVPEPANPTAAPGDTADGRPGDDFNARGDVRVVLRRHGWTLAKGGDNEYWRRPGKSSGWSATLKSGVFYVFSSSAVPFEAEHAYSPFAVYALLEHGGDYAKAASALRAEGYGNNESSLRGVDLSRLTSNLSSASATPLAPPLKSPKSVRVLLQERPQLRPPVIHGLLRQGETINVISSPKMGKALAIDTPILTDTGWRTMGELEPGMRVHSADGSLTRIVAVSEILQGRPCYRVTTKSGATVVADEEHLWNVTQRHHAAIVTTKDLAGGFQGRRWLLPVAGPLDREFLDLPLDPWVLGYWLGNGTAREGAISVNHCDVAEAVRELHRAGFETGKPSSKRGCTTFTVRGLRVILRRMGLLGCKRIPEAYLLAARDQRAALLAGLLDSDGHASTRANGSGAVEFTTTDADLFFQVLILVRSLGRKASTSIGRAQLHGVDCGNKLRITFAASRKDSPFRFSRRTAALPDRPVSQRSHRDPVATVISVPSVPVKCIQVAHPSSSFLVGHDFTVTHNSWLVTDLALAVVTGRPWLETFETVRGDVLIIDNELHLETIANRIPKVAGARGIPLEKFADHLFVESLRGGLRDLLNLGPYFLSLEPGRYRMIILDAFYRFLPPKTDENDNGSMASLYNHLDLFAARLGCSFVLIHHTTKGNQSAKSVTDVGAGAGSQSRAADTHLILRPHEETDVVVLDATVRSWPPIQPLCLKWTFPVWTPDPALDPAALRSEPQRRKKRAETTNGPSKPEWDLPTFLSAFVDEQPRGIETIVASARDAGLSERVTRRFLKQAEADGLIFRWYFGSNTPVGLATTLPPNQTSDDDF